MTIPLLLIAASLLLLTRTRPDSKASNNIRLAFLSGTMLMTVSSLINVFVLNYYFKDGSWIDNTEVINHLSFLGTIGSQVGLMICGIAAILLVRSFLKGDIHSIRAK